MILLPILQISVFCNTIGLEPKSLQFGVINEENCTHQNTEECRLESMSCRILDQLHENVIFKIQNYLNETDISQDLQNGVIYGYLKFPANFSSALTSRILNGLEIEAETLNQSLVQIHLDTSSYPLTVSITNALFNEVLTFLINFVGLCDMSEYLVSLPYTLDDPVTKIDTADFRTFMAPGIMIVLIFFLSVTLTGDTFIEGKQVRNWINISMFRFFTM